MSAALGFISFAIVASALGPELLAYFALAQVYALVVNDLFNVQTWESLIKFGTKKGDKELLARTIKTNVLIDIISAFGAFIIAIIAAGQVGAILGWDESLIELAALYSFVIPSTITTLTIGVPRLFDRFTAIAKIQVAIAVLKLMSMIVVSYFEGDARQFIVTYVALDILLNLSLMIFSVSLLKSQKILGWVSTRIYLSRDQLKFLWWTNLRTIVRIPIRQADILIINQVMSMESVGIYKVYKEIVGIIGRLGEPINQAIYPEYARLLGQGGSIDTVSITKKIVRILLSVAALTLVVFIGVSKFVIELGFGIEYVTFINVLYVLATLHCVSLFLTPINSLFMAAGFAKHSFYIVLLNNIVYLAIATIGGTYFGMYGIVLAFGVQVVLNKGLKIVYLMKYPTGWGSMIR